MGLARTHHRGEDRSDRVRSSSDPRANSGMSGTRCRPCQRQMRALHRCIPVRPTRAYRGVARGRQVRHGRRVRDLVPDCVRGARPVVVEADKSLSSSPTVSQGSRSAWCRVGDAWHLEGQRRRTTMRWHRARIAQVRTDVRPSARSACGQRHERDAMPSMFAQ